MSAPVKPLFRPDAVRPALAAFLPPPAAVAARPKLAAWADRLVAGGLDGHKETELLPGFLHDVFGGVLGYTGPPAAAYTLKREALVKVDGKFADAGLGRFAADGAAGFAAVLEGKGPRDPLDRPFAGRKRSAVEQALQYAVQLQIDWYLVTNLREIRLLHKGHDTQTFERFDTAAVAADDGLFRRFVFLLGADRVVPPGGGPNHLDAVLAASRKVGRELTEEFYREYRDLRRQTFAALRAHNPDQVPATLLAATQKILDRVLFVAFCEDRGLLPANIIARAYEQENAFSARPVWDNFLGLFRAVDAGSPKLRIERYNGGLFAPDPNVDALVVPDEVCAGFKKLAEYEYGDDPQKGKAIDVEILGHIFEQSITDLETLHREIAGRATAPPAERGKRKLEGAFYTPAFVTRYIVAETLGPVLRERFAALRARHEADAGGTAKRVLLDPAAFDPDGLNDPQRKALARFWGARLDDLETVRVVDPACGSGAFLIEAFDQLFAEYGRAQGHLTTLVGPTLFDTKRTILTKNLYGVGLERGGGRDRPAVVLDQDGRAGQGTHQPGRQHPGREQPPRPGRGGVAGRGLGQAVPGRGGGRRVRRRGRQPALRPARVDQGDEAGVTGALQGVRRDGRPVCVLLRAGAEPAPARRPARVHRHEQVDEGRLRGAVTAAVRRSGVGRVGGGPRPQQGHLPGRGCVPVYISSPETEQRSHPPPSVRICALPREQYRVDDLSRQVATEGADVPRGRFGAAAWSLEPPGVVALMDKLRANGVPLNEYAGTTPYRGVLTGFNEAFIVDGPTRDRLIAEHANSAAVLKKYLRGADVERWQSEWSGEWIIFARRGISIDDFPAIKRHLEQFRRQLEPKPKNFTGDDWPGRKPGSYKWYELQDAADYWPYLERPKIVWPDLTWRPCFFLDTHGLYVNDTTFFLSSVDTWLMAVVNSPAMWAWMWRNVIHGKDETLRLKNIYTEQLPIPRPTDAIRAEVETLVARLIDLQAGRTAGIRAVLDWLRAEFGIGKPSQKLAALVGLSPDEFVAEVRKLRPKTPGLSVAGVKRLRDAHAESVAPLQTLDGEAAGLERRVSDAVNAAYGLSPAEVRLMWATAPPRMPTPRPPA